MRAALASRRGNGRGDRDTDRADAIGWPASLFRLAGRADADPDRRQTWSHGPGLRGRNRQSRNLFRTFLKVGECQAHLTHIDVGGKGGYVIAPPSGMVDGRRYHWLIPGGEILPLLPRRLRGRDHPTSSFLWRPRACRTARPVCGGREKLKRDCSTRDARWRVGPR
ncbi:bifunctional DNA primase/polymerase [Bosea sp. LC85]|uniref:bifunctional DNA primase/polymerase n=1 Tax=Bosea sp. LC85 TaxID=1502851 RepID=UPI001377BA18